VFVLGRGSYVRINLDTLVSFLVFALIISVITQSRLLGKLGG
jgi:hypothetical protein